MEENIKSLSNIFTILLLLSTLLFSVTLSFILNHKKSEEVFFCGVKDMPKCGNIEPPFDSTDKKLVAGKTLFIDNCTSCHSVNVRKVGPALSGITERRNKKWIRNFIRNSQKMIEAKDPVALKLYKENSMVSMTNFSNMTNREIDAILYYIDNQSSH